MFTSLAPPTLKGEYPGSLRQRSRSTSTGIIRPRLENLNCLARSSRLIASLRATAMYLRCLSLRTRFTDGGGGAAGKAISGFEVRPRGDLIIITDFHACFAYSRVFASYTRYENVRSSARSRISDRPKLTRSKGSSSRFSDSAGTPAATKASETAENVAASPVDTITRGRSNDGYPERIVRLLTGAFPHEADTTRDVGRSEPWRRHTYVDRPKYLVSGGVQRTTTSASDGARRNTGDNPPAKDGRAYSIAPGYPYSLISASSFKSCVNFNVPVSLVQPPFVRSPRKASSLAARAASAASPSHVNARAIPANVANVKITTFERIIAKRCEASNRPNQCSCPGLFGEDLVTEEVQRIRGLSRKIPGFHRQPFRYKWRQSPSNTTTTKTVPVSGSHCTTTRTASPRTV